MDHIYQLIQILYYVKVDIYISCNNDKTGNHKEFKRKSTGQNVRFDSENEIQNAHYHWLNDMHISSGKIDNSIMYKDRYGNICSKGSRRSHLAPLDEKYKSKKRGK